MILRSEIYTQGQRATHELERVNGSIVYRRSDSSGVLEQRPATAIEEQAFLAYEQGETLRQNEQASEDSIKQRIAQLETIASGSGTFANNTERDAAIRLIALVVARAARWLFKVFG